MKCLNAVLVPWEENSHGTMQPMFGRLGKGEICHAEWHTIANLVACGYCYYCLKKRSRDWTFRLFYEQKKYIRPPVAVTLTYNQRTLHRTTSCQVMQLFYRDVQLYFKRLRKKFKGCRIRYFIAGEYGRTRKRPHYHLIIFGLPQEAYENWQVCHLKGKTTENGSVAKTTQYYCPLLHKIWDKGISVYSVVQNQAAIAYVTGYAIKKRNTTQRMFPNYKIITARKMNRMITEGNEADLSNFTHIRKGSNLINLETGEIEHVFEFNHQSKRLGDNFLDDMDDVIRSYKEGNFIDGKAYYPPRYYRKKLFESMSLYTFDHLIGRYDFEAFKDLTAEYKKQGQTFNVSYAEYRDRLKIEAEHSLQNQYAMRQLE